MKEIWKPIEGYNGAYEVSNTGKVRSWKNNRHGRSDKARVLCLMDDSHGYPQITLSLKNPKKRGSKKVHTLVAKAFIPNPENKPCINHIDGDKENNHVDNLEWCTYSENQQHAYDTGLRIPTEGAKGSKNGNSKLTREDVLDIRNAYALGCFSQRHIAKAYNVSQANIKCIVNNETWTHI